MSLGCILESNFPWFQSTVKMFNSPFKICSIEISVLDPLLFRNSSFILFLSTFTTIPLPLKSQYLMSKLVFKLS